VDQDWYCSAGRHTFVDSRYFATDKEALAWHPPPKNYCAQHDYPNCDAHNTTISHED
jgi:hypothetical protein